MASNFHFTQVTYTQTILFEMNKILLQKVVILVSHLLYYINCNNSDETNKNSDPEN